MTNLSQRGAGIFGPAIGAAIVAIGGTSLAFGLNCLSFFISAICILFIVMERGKNHQRNQIIDNSNLKPERSNQFLPKWKIALRDLQEGLSRCYFFNLALGYDSYIWVN